MLTAEQLREKDTAATKEKRDQATIQEILAGDYYPDIASQKHVYIIRDHRSEAIFYVGSSLNDAPHRIRIHIQQHTGIGRFILRNRPLSLSWIVEFLDHAEILGQAACRLLDEDSQIREAETQLIRELGPSFNIANNPNAQPIPDAYVHWAPTPS